MIRTHLVPDDPPRERLDAYALSVFDELGSRAQARKLIKKGALRVVGLPETRSALWVRAGWILELDPPRKLPGPDFRVDLDILYTDPHLAIVDKPPGLVTSGNRHRTLARALPHVLPPSEASDALPICVPVHRLDARTQGLVVVARSARAQVALGQAFQERRVQKRYEALVTGRLEGEGRIELPLEQRPAATRWQATHHARSLHVDWVTQVSCWPETGRNHQIRRHLARIGHPVLGDAHYTTGTVLTGNGLFLAAVALTLPHPVTGEPVHVARDSPYKFQSYLAREQRRWESAN